MPWKPSSGPTFQSSPSPKVCDIRINDATLGDHRAMLEAVKSDPNANKLAYRLHYETQTAYIKARDGGQRAAFCKDFIAANTQYAKARFTAVIEDHMSHVSTSVQKAIAYNVCGASAAAKLSKADWKPYALIKKMLQIELKSAKENEIGRASCRERVELTEGGVCVKK